MSQPTPDVRAVVRVLDALLTQVKRIADHTATGSFALVPRPVVDTDDAPTTADDVPRCVCGDPIEQTGDPAYWIHSSTDSVTPCTGARPKLPPMDPVHILGIKAEAPAADEDAHRADRRASLRNLLSRASAGLTPDEDALLRQHVEAEIREADQWRAGRNTMKQRGEDIERDRDRLAAELEDAEQRAEAFREQRDQARGERDRSDEAARRAMEQRQEMAEERYAWQERGDQAERDLRVLRSGLRAAGGDPTQIQNLWAQIRMRNRQWREEKQRVQRLETAARQVLDICGEQGSDVQDILRAALDGTEQPTTEQP